MATRKRLEKMSKPVIAAINGYALGGGRELAMACDIRYAGQRAKMGLTEAKLGVICGSGGTQRLSRIVGDSIAREMIYTGKTIDADEAMRIGLVNRVLPQDELMDAAIELAETICRNGQLAVRASKDCINYAQDHDIEAGCLFERKRFAELFTTEDQKIGMGGFLRKEKEIIFKNKQEQLLCGQLQPGHTTHREDTYASKIYNCNRGCGTDPGPFNSSDRCFYQFLSAG